MSEGAIGCLVVFLLVLTAFVAIAAAATHAGRRRHRNELQEALLGLSLTGPGMNAHPTEPLLRFSAGPRQAELRFTGFDPDLAAGTLVEVDFRDHVFGSLHIVHEDWAGPRPAPGRLQDLTVGDALFDRDFRVRADPPDLVPWIFSRDRRGALIGNLRAVPNLISVDLNAHSLSIRASGHLMELMSLRTLLRSAQLIAERLSQRTPDEGIRWVESGPSGVGQCQVCLGEMTEDVVLCSKCRTPHHRLCWIYAGKCSTFACRAVEFTVDGRRIKGRR